MAFTTYAELQTAIGSWLNRSDLTSTIPDFITLAEAQLQRDLDHWQMTTRDTLSVSTQYTSLPADFYALKRLSVDGAKRALKAMSANEMQDARYTSDDTAGEPRYYAVTGGSLEVFPTPDDTYTVNIVYKTTFDALSDANTSNWLLTEAPDAYLYGALMQSAPFLVDDKRIAVWQTLYASAVEGVQRSSEQAKFGTNLRIRG